MTAWPAGFAIHERATVADPELVEAFREIPTTVIGDCLGFGAGAVGLRPFHGDPALGLCGVALTVRVRPGDNLMLHKALTLARSGDNVPISCAGLLVSPGDLVLGDADGVVAASPGRLPSLLDEARALLAEEDEKQRHQLASREDRSLWARDEERVDAWLRAKGCPV